MPLIAFKPADVLRNKVLEPGWYGAKIVKVTDWKASSNADSYNMNVVFLIANTEGKEVERLFNSKAISMMLPLIQAATGLVIKPEEFNFNTDDLMNKEVDVKIGVKTYEGRLSNEIVDYITFGRSKDAPAF